MSIIGTSLCKFYRIISRRLFYSKHFLGYEKAILTAWRNSLSAQANEILSQQLDADYYIQRPGWAKSIIYHYSQKEKDTLPVFETKCIDVHVATVFLQLMNGKKIPAKIYLHQGLFFSIEFPLHPIENIKNYIKPFRKGQFEVVALKTFIPL
jgi:hypothetical protein